jgi:hypothetical protein
MSYLGEGQDFRRQNLSSQSRVRDIENRFQREADINKFNQRMNDFTKFQAATNNRGNISGNVPKIGGNYMLAVREPQLTARQPTFREAGGDFMRGIGNFAQAFADKGPPILQLIKSAGQGISEFVNKPFQNMQNQFQNMQNQEGSLAMQIRALTPEQRVEYDRLVGLQGFTIQDALKKVTGMAMGGIATLL